MDNLAYLTSDHSIKKMAILLKKSGKIALEWGINNSVIYDISKIKAILFFKVCYPKLARQIAEIRLKIGRKRIFFNKKAT